MRQLENVNWVSLPLGVPVHCLVNKVEKLDAILVGFEVGSFLVLKFPYLTCISKYLVEGVPFAGNVTLGSRNVFFGSTVEAAIAKKFLAICTYPSFFKVFDMRSKQRVQCLVPVGVSLRDVYYTGVLRDINAGGCQLVLDAVHGRALRHVAQGESLVLELTTLNGPMPLNGEVVHFKKDLTRTTLGLVFRDLDAKGYAELMAYVQGVSQPLE